MQGVEEVGLLDVIEVLVDEEVALEGVEIVEIETVEDGASYVGGGAGATVEVVEVEFVVEVEAAVVVDDSGSYVDGGSGATVEVVEVEVVVVAVVSGSSAVTVATTVSVTVGPSVTIWVTISVVISYPGPPSTGTTEYGTCLCLISLSKICGDNGRALRVTARDEATRRIVRSLSSIARRIGQKSSEKSDNRFEMTPG